jgi:hypothetical protein
VVWTSIIIIILSPTHHAVADDALLGGVAPAAVSPGTSLRDVIINQHRGGKGDSGRSDEEEEEERG